MSLLRSPTTFLPLIRVPANCPVVLRLRDNFLHQHLQKEASSNAVTSLRRQLLRLIRRIEDVDIEVLEIVRDLPQGMLITEELFLVFALWAQPTRMAAKVPTAIGVNVFQCQFQLLSFNGNSRWSLRGRDWRIFSFAAARTPSRSHTHLLASLIRLNTMRRSLLAHQKEIGMLGRTASLVHAVNLSRASQL